MGSESTYPIEAVGLDLVSFDGRVIERFSGPGDAARIHLYNVTGLTLEAPDRLTAGLPALQVAWEVSGRSGRMTVPYDPSAQAQFEALVAAVNAVLASWRGSQ